MLDRKRVVSPMGAPSLTVGRGVVLAALVSVWTAWGAGCASSEIPRRSEEPRTTSVPGVGVYRWSRERGWVQPDRGHWGSAQHAWTEARRALEAEAYADALAGFLAVREEVEEAPPATVASFKELNFSIGECYFRLGNYAEALDFYREVYRKDLPSPELVDQARRRVYDIGIAYLQGKIPCDFLSLGLLHYTCSDYGVDILVGPEGGLVTENPDLPYAADAMIEVAHYYFRSGEYPESVPIYDRVASMEQTEWRDLAQYQAALAVFRQIRGVQYDQEIILSAERRFRGYLERHPRGARVDEARARVVEISEMKGAQNLRIAKFYLRSGEPRACKIYLDRVLLDQPNSAAATEAREIQEQLEREGGTW